MRSVALEPETEAFLEELAASGDPPIEHLTPLEARAAERNRQAIDIYQRPAVIRDISIPVAGGPAVAVRIVRPVGAIGLLPAVVYFHGGGWVVGGVDTHDRWLRELADGCGAAIAFVDYTRSPEATYPTAVEEGYAAASWLQAHGSTVAIDGRRLAVAGESSGGNIATVVALLAKQRRGPRLLQQVLICPATDARFDQASFDEFAEGYFLTPSAMHWFWDHYAPDHRIRDAPTASPLRASLRDLEGLPPALVLTAEADVLRDQGEAYARKLTAAGVRVTAVRYLGVIHNFIILNALSRTQSARGGLQQVTQVLSHAFAETAEGSFRSAAGS
jgi:acetyl esterase